MLGSVKNGLLPVGDRQLWLRRGVELALAVLAAIMTLGLISQIRYSRAALPAYVEPAAPSAYQDAARWSGNIVQHHLFGESAAASAKTAQAAIDNLSLTGIIYSTNPDDSRAILQANDTTLVVAPGAELADGGKVTGIGVDRVEIERNGATEELLLQIDSAGLSTDPGFASAGQNGDLDEDPSGQALADSANAATPPSAPMTQVFHASAVPLSAIRGKAAKERFKTLLPPVLPAKKAKKP